MKLIKNVNYAYMLTNNSNLLSNICLLTITTYVHVVQDHLYAVIAAQLSSPRYQDWQGAAGYGS